MYLSLSLPWVLSIGCRIQSCAWIWCQIPSSKCLNLLWLSFQRSYSLNSDQTSSNQSIREKIENSIKNNGVLSNLGQICPNCFKLKWILDVKLQFTSHSTYYQDQFVGILLQLINFGGGSSFGEEHSRTISKSISLSSLILEVRYILCNLSS